MDNYDQMLINDEKKQEAKRLRFMGYEPAFAKYQFSNFEVSSGNKNNFDACKKFTEKPFNLFVWGGAGCGKSRLAWTAFFSACQANKCLGRFLPWEDFESGVAQDFEDRRTSFQDKLLDYNFIVLDDILREKPGKLTETALIRFLEKWTDRQKKGLIITSNNSVEVIGELIKNDRLPSRLCEVIDLFVENTGPDWRVRNLKQKTVKSGQQLNFNF